MASRKDELNKAKEAGKSIVAKQTVEKPAVDNNPNKEEKTEPKKQQSLVANKFGDPNSKSYKDVLRENGNDPAKMAEWMNNNPGYKAGNATKEGMAGFGYIQGEDGKWALKPKTETPAATTSTPETKTTTDTTTSTKATTDDPISELEKIMAENEKLKKQIEALQNPDGSIKEDEAKSAWDEHMQKGLEMGAVTLDKDGNYVLTNVNKKGWEDWATMISAGASVIGLAMGVPIIPINFRKITGKDEKDEAIREFQKQLTDISAGNLAKVKDVESSKQAGDYIKENQGSIDAFTNYVDKTASYKAKSDIDTESEKELIETRTDAQIRADQAKFDNDMKRLDADNNFKLNYAYLQNEYGKDFAAFTDALSTNSAKELLKYQNTDMLKEIQRMVNEGQIDFTDMAKYSAMKQGIRPSDVTWNRVMQGIDAGTKVLNSVGNTLESLNPLKIKK